MLQVALGQHGCEAYRRTTLKLEQAKTTEGATIKVVVHEADGNLQETPAPLGSAAFARALVKVSARVHGRRGRRKSGAGKEEEDDEPRPTQVTGMCVEGCDAHGTHGIYVYTSSPCLS